MEVLCRATHLLSSSCNTKHLFYNLSLPQRHSSLSLSFQGLHSYQNSSLRSSNSDETPSGTDQLPNAKHDSFGNIEDKKPFEVHDFGKNVPNETPEDVVHHQTWLGQAYEEGPLSDLKYKIAEFLDTHNFKFDSEDSYSIALYGSSAAAALYLATAVIGAIDSIPVFPKLMEVVGLGYSVWFANRYLLFKKTRDELAAKIEELKQEVLGSEDE